jgi:phage baseplate assembly protein W
MSDPAFLGRGWAFPASFSAGGADVDMASGVADIEQSLRILLGTWPGERVMQETFGCDLGSLVFAELDQRLINTVERLVGDAVLEHEPRIKVDRIDVDRSADEVSVLIITVHYTVRGTNSRYNYVFPFYLTEATPVSGR